jgi:hypothetical protein
MRLQTDQEFLASSLVPTHVPEKIEEQLADCYGISDVFATLVFAQRIIFRSWLLSELIGAGRIRN